MNNDRDLLPLSRMTDYFIQTYECFFYFLAAALNEETTTNQT